MTSTDDRLLGSLVERRYRIDALIARGGMSSVYLGMDTRLDRPVAVKVMDQRYAHDEQFINRLEFEARSVARLKDPGLVAVYDQGLDGECAFLVMELVEGGTLRELLRERGPMPPHAVNAVAAPVLRALGVAHRAGLVHRDVKPENVLISETGDVKVADFGLVRAVAAAGVTSNSVILGTAAYLSPEQVESSMADARSDVYAAGILVFEMLTGQTPFRADTPLGLAYQRLGTDVPAPSSVIDGVPPQFDEFVRIATSRYPEQRFADGHDMCQALEAIADDLALPPFTVPAPTRSAERDTADRLRNGEPSGPPPRQVTRIQTAPSDRPDDLPPAHPDRSAMRDSPTMSPAMTAAADRFDADAPRRRRAVLIWLTVVVVLALLLGLFGWWGGSGRFTRVPNISGMDRGAAVQAIEDAGLDVVDDPVYSNTATVDQVFGTKPVAGQRVTRFSDVTLRYSLGQPKVPDLRPGASQPEVTELLRERTLRGRVSDHQYSTDVPKGGVVSLSPSSGTTVAVGSAVGMVVSRGPAPVTIPDLRGRTEEETARLLTAAGLKIGSRTKEFDAKTDGGKTIRTNPSIGSTVDAGSTVNIVISDAITVPDLSGLTPEEARAALDKVGLTAVDGGTSSAGTAPAGRVTAASPNFGDRVDPRHPQVAIKISDAVQMPDVTGNSVDSARKKLEGLGLTVTTRGLNTPISIVINQDKGAGSRLARGTTVVLTTLP